MVLALNDTIAPPALGQIKTPVVSPFRHAAVVGRHAQRIVEIGVARHVEFVRSETLMGFLGLALFQQDIGLARIRGGGEGGNGQQEGCRQNRPAEKEVAFNSCCEPARYRVAAKYCQPQPNSKPAMRAAASIGVVG
ncbi:MAG: hypothetical protein AB1513_06125 [Pseudomonadota bacterium]